MARTTNRKGQGKSPAIHPDEAKSIEIPEDEQWRLINGSGVLHKVSSPTSPQNNVHEGDDEEVSPLAEEIFRAVTLIMPFSFFLLLMDVLIHHQYAKQATIKELVDRLITSVPILSIFVFYSTRYKATQRMQLILFVLSIAVGTRMIWLVNRGSWLVNIKQCPPLATIWLYTVIQLDLAWAVLSLIGIGGWVWWAGMKLKF